MGMDAELIGFGKFDRSIADCMDYPAEDYEDVKDGTMVCTTLLPCNTTATSILLAECLNLSDAHDFNHHFLNNEYLLGLESTIRSNFLCHCETFDMSHVEKLFRLARKGFNFFYRPEA